MKLVFITHNFPIDRDERSNAGVFVWDIARFLIKQDCSIIVFVLNSNIEKVKKLFSGKLILYFLERGSLKKSLSKVKPYNLLDIIKTFNLFMKGKQSIMSILKTEKVDFCIAFWAIPSGIIAYEICKKLKIPYAIWALGSDIYIYNKYPIIGNLIFKSIINSSLVFADGLNLVKEVRKISNKKCVFLPSVTDFKIKNTAKLLVDNKKTNFVFLGRMERVKGPDILFSSLLRLQKNANFHTYFIGSGSLLNELKVRSTKHNLDKKITFLGNINSKDIIYSYLRKCDYLVVPSRSDSIPLVLSEGAKAGIPFIVSDVGDMSYFIKKYNIGYTFLNGSIDRLSELLEMVIKRQKKDRKIMKDEICEFAKIFDVNEISQELSAYVKKLSKNI